MSVAPGNAHVERKTQEQLYLLFVLGCVGYFLLTYLVRPLFDPDFFWHLKSGEIIFNTGGLPDSDLFSIDGTTRPDMRQQFLLTSYWASQLLYYVLYDLFDYSGIVILRIVIVSALTYFIYKRCSGDKWLIVGVLLIFMQLFLQLYPLERPQIFSFLFFATLLLLIDRCREAISRKEIARLSIFSFLMMLVWANSHGGFILGQFVLVYYSASAVYFCFVKKQLSARHAFEKLFVFFCGLTASLINPNFTNYIDVAVKPFGKNKEYYSIISEYGHLFDQLLTFAHVNRLYVIAFALCLLFYFARLPAGKTTDLILCFVLFVIGCYQIRYVGFFMIMATPLVIQAISRQFSSQRGRLLLVVYLLVFSQVVIFGRYEFSNMGGVFAGGFVREGVFTPVAAAEFVRKEDRSHNILGNYSWGGYLLHRLSPRDKLFVDGRTMYEDRCVTWQLLAENGIEHEVEGKNVFDEVVSKYAIDTIILPKYAAGGVLRMTAELKERDEWTVAYHDKFNVVFALNPIAAN